MPRKGEVPKRKVLPDPKYTDAPGDVRRRMTKFVNVVMRDGKKQIAEGIVYGAMDMVAERAKDDPLKVWERALAHGMRWLVEYARERNEKTMADRLANEIVDAAQNRGNAVKKREDVHKMADANKAFAHYRW